MTAQPASQKQFVIVREVATSASRTFQALVSVEGMMGWVPMCRSAVWQHPKGARGPGLGSMRVISLHGGVVAHEEIVHWQPGRQLNYRFRPPAAIDVVAHDYQGVTRVDPTGPNSCRLTWTGHFDAPGARALLAPLVRLGLGTLIGVMAMRLARIAEAG